ncbi:phage tail tip lysozyme [Actinoplanes sp. NPDC051513]|uniref:phage tail tip lysozyme n=1 Tax=Actinoplanes sp. NPDC051513 TaxID=3363908 RepID=UPI0037A70AF5
MPTSQPIVVLDPGHGGTVPAGASTPDRTVAGLSERGLTLGLARRVRALLAPTCTVMLTRDSDANVSLDGRAAFARLAGADYFVSLHFNAATDPALDTTEAYVARNSSEGDRELATALHESVRGALGTTSGGVLAADLGVVARSRHLDRTRVALLEACDLSNPRRAGELRDPASLERLAQAVATAILTRCQAERAGATLAVRAMDIDLDASEVLNRIKAAAHAAAGTRRAFTGSERFVTVLASRYLADYLAAPGPATAEAAIARIAAQNTTGVVTQVCGRDDYWEAMFKQLNDMKVPLLSSVPGLSGLLDKFGAATDIISVANRYDLDHIDGPYLVGAHGGIDLLACNQIEAAVLDPDLLAGADRNESQLMHWATGVKYGDTGHERIRDFFVAYEMWHLEQWDVFGRDPINDLIAEDAGWTLAQALRSGTVTGPTLLGVLDDAFARGRRWVGGLLSEREAALDAQVLALRPPDMHVHWGRWVIRPDSPHHPYPIPSVRAMLQDGRTIDQVMASRQVADYIDVYTLIAEARRTPEPVSGLQRIMAAGDLDWAFRAAAGDEKPPTTSVTTLATGFEPLDDGEWELVHSWLTAGAVGQTPLTGDADANALRIAVVLFCQRRLQQSFADPATCPDPTITEWDPDVQRLAGEVAARGPIVHWPARTMAERQRYAIDRLIRVYGYPLGGAAGIVGNLTKESGVLPSRIEGSAEATPLRAKDYKGKLRDWSPREIMDRTGGPEKAGIGLAQWTWPSRRAGLFAYAYGAAPAGPRILFDMDAQIDYLVHELRTATDFKDAERMLMMSMITVDDASDEFMYSVENPGDMNAKPRDNPAVQAEFAKRRTYAQEALRAYTDGQ